jgi:GxxExxY protein
MEFGMNTAADREELNRITERVLGCAYQVSNTLGCGFLEKVYENALAHELHKQNIPAQQQHPIHVRYDGAIVGEYVADLLVDGKVLIELKAVRALDEIHSAQCINYLKATNLTICLLLNFAHPRLEVKRLVHNF